MNNNNNNNRDLWAIDGNDLMQLQIAARLYVNGLEDSPRRQKLLDTIERTRFTKLRELTAPRE